jgi:hypothetical protein
MKNGTKCKQPNSFVETNGSLSLISAISLIFAIAQEIVGLPISTLHRKIATMLNRDHFPRLASRSYHYVLPKVARPLVGLDPDIEGIPTQQDLCWVRLQYGDKCRRLLNAHKAFRLSQPVDPRPRHRHFERRFRLVKL